MSLANLFYACYKIFMSRAYLSEIFPWWTLERQEEALAAKVPDWPNGVRRYVDRLDEKQRRGHRIEDLVQRTLMLRATTRSSVETVYVASLAVLGWGEKDVKGIMDQIAARGWSLVPADGFPATLEGWRAARQQSRLEGASKRGAAASAQRRGERARDGAERIRDRWGWPSDAKMAARWGMPFLETASTADLLAEGGISRGAANHYLKMTREQAQSRFRAKIKARMTRAAAKEQT